MGRKFKGERQLFGARLQAPDAARVRLLRLAVAPGMTINDFVADLVLRGLSAVEVEFEKGQKDA